MKGNQALRAGGAVLLFLLGGLLAALSSRPYSEKRYLVDAGSCRLNMTVVQLRDSNANSGQGAVVLLHGLSANRIIMSYLARSLAQLGLRVYVPDLPGHGRSPGPFTPERAEACSLSLVRGLAARGLISPDHTLLAGHSMGGAIAIRIASKFRPAGVIAISPAPMQAANGVIGENLLFNDHAPAPLTPNTLVMVGQFELHGLVANAADLVSTSSQATARFLRVPGNTHVSVLFSPAVARESQDWAARVLRLPAGVASLPSHGNLLGCLLGLLGILILAGPFLRELLGNQSQGEPSPPGLPSRLRVVFEFVILASSTVLLLRYLHPFRILHLFEGDYLAGFLFISGLLVFLVHRWLVLAQFRVTPSALIGAAVGGLLLHFLITGWFELTANASWLTLQRWTRFPLFFLVAFLFLFVLECLVDPTADSRQSLLFWFVLIAICWAALAGGVFFLRSGEILFILLLPYFALCFLLLGMGTRLVRRLSGSAPAAAVFGAILLTGFCLVLFPVS